MLININVDGVNTEERAMATDGSERGRGLTTADVAEILGIKRQTVYAYVSRGILHRQMALDGRTSLFDRTEVQELRLGRRPEQEGEMRTMLATRLTRVADDGLWIRGRDLVQMVNGGAGFTEVADLLWDSPPEERWPLAAGDRPARTAIGRLEDDGGPIDGVAPRPGVPAQLRLLDQLRVILATESSADPLRHDLSPRGVRGAGRRAIVAMANGVGTPPAGPPDGTSSLGGLLWGRLSGEPARAAQRSALDAGLALLADHGLAASTFAARVAASVRADPYSVVFAGLGVLGGTLHGAASAEVHEMYLEADRRGDAAAVVGDLQRKGRVPGFGHTVYRDQDPRYGALMAKIVDAWSDDRRLYTVFRVRDVMGERSDEIPNLDLAIGALTYLAAMPTDAGEAVFAISRTAGWLAHAIEEYEEKPLRFRPRARYIGDQPPGP